MSMFHELMMRKKEQIMYATIKGTLTENDGVFSGFAYNNYLETQEVLDTSKDFEICIKTNTGTVSGNLKTLLRNSFGSSAGSTGITIGIQGSSGKLLSYIVDENGTYIANADTGQTTFSNDTDYFFKFSQKKVNNEYIINLESSTDGTNWTIENTWTSSTKIRNSGQGVAFGGGALNLTAQYWGGSIDLPNSYIKLGSTKYNLQAVVGYTKVGSPTITDGVASGFSNGNYLNINKSSGDVYKFEMIAHIGNIPQTISNNQLIFALLGDITSRLFLTSNNTIRFQYKDINNSTKYLDISTIPTYIKIILNETNEQIYSSNDGINWSLEDNKTLSPILINMFTSIRFGYLSNTFNVFNGDLYIKDTSIKINNKLWFNGQPT